MFELLKVKSFSTYKKANLYCLSSSRMLFCYCAYSYFIITSYLYYNLDYRVHLCVCAIIRGMRMQACENLYCLSSSRMLFCYCVCVYAYMYVHVCLLGVYTCVFMCSYMCVYVFGCVRGWMRVYVNVTLTLYAFLCVLLIFKTLLVV